MAVVALVVAFAMAGVVLWGIAVIGVAQYAEDICFDDLYGRAEYGAATTAAELWPPSFECRLRGKDVDPIVVQHRSVALARLGAVVLFPVVYAVAATVGVVLWLRRRRPPGTRI